MKTVFYLVLVMTALPAIAASAQRLEIENRTTEGDPITVSGTVVEVKKYSFVLDTPSGQQTIRLGRGAEFQLKLYKPVFKPKAKKLLVQLPNAEEPDNRKELGLPEQLYLQVSFAHKNQMNRVMSTNPKRFNNYQLARTPFPAPGEDSAITGQLIVVDDDERYRLKTPDSVEHDIILGHQNALMGGFSIQDLTPMTTQVEVVGVKNVDAIVASRALFWPIGND